MARAIILNIPHDLQEQMTLWEETKVYGNITLDYKDGVIVGWSTHQTHRPTTTSSSKGLTEPPDDT